MVGGRTRDECVEVLERDGVCLSVLLRGGVVPCPVQHLSSKDKVPKALTGGGKRQTGPQSDCCANLAMWVKQDRKRETRRERERRDSTKKKSVRRKRRGVSPLYLLFLFSLWANRHEWLQLRSNWQSDTIQKDSLSNTSSSVSMFCNSTVVRDCFDFGSTSAPFFLPVKCSYKYFTPINR